MMIQKGLKPPSEKIEMPNWIDRLQTETISNNTAIMTKTITEKIAQLHLTVEDFLEGGRLAYYPNEGVTFLSDNMIKNLGMSNLTTKESKTLLSHINKTMREMRKTITSARRAQEERLVKIEKHVQNMKKKTESKQKEPRKLSL
jgi:Na+/phosphate symporter